MTCEYCILVNQSINIYIYIFFLHTHSSVFCGIVKQWESEASVNQTKGLTLLPPSPWTGLQYMIFTFTLKHSAVLLRCIHYEQLSLGWEKADLVAKQHKKLSNVSAALRTHCNTYWSATSKTLSFFLWISFTRAFIQTACASLSPSLPPPSVRVSTSSLWAPGQTLLFIFLSKSNESHMHTHANAHFCIYTLTQTPLYLRQSIPAFTPTRSPLQSVARLLFQVPVSLVTLSVLAPPSRHSKAKRRGCQSKQPTCIQTHAHLACLCSHDPYEFTNTALRLCSCTWLCRSGHITMDSWQSFKLLEWDLMIDWLTDRLEKKTAIILIIYLSFQSIFRQKCPKVLCSDS